jgi:hypothetical protein
VSDLILDFETIGQSVITAPILNCSFFLFDTERFVSKNPYTYGEVLDGTWRLKLSVEDQVKKGYKIRSEDLAFWDSVGPEAKKQLVPKSNDLTYDQFCDTMMDRLRDHRVDFWWSRSNTFDPILLWRIFEDCGRSEELNQKLKFWKVRDVRTYIDAKTDFALARNGFVPMDQREWDAKFKAHDSRHDITGDVLRLQKLVRLEHDLI